MTGAGFVGNNEIKHAVSAMTASGKISHSIIITGPEGSGKKTAAEYMGAALLCSSPNKDGSPCFQCTSCRMVMHGGHPDFSVVRPSGKNGAYLLDSDLRPLVADAYIRPSQSEYKVAAIFDMDRTQPGAQNVLLKLLEEPPAHMIVIMTACSKEYFLPTILSRVTLLRTELLTREDCKKAAAAACGQEFSEEKFAAAFSAMGGNAGRCVQFICGGNLSKAVEITDRLCAALCARDEYGLLAALWKTDSDRNMLREVLKLLSGCLRDSAVFAAAGKTASPVSCCSGRTEKLAETLGARRSAELLGLCEEFISRINGNGSVPLSIHAFAARAADCLI